MFFIAIAISNVLMHAHRAHQNYVKSRLLTDVILILLVANFVFSQLFIFFLFFFIKWHFYTLFRSVCFYIYFY